MKANKTICLPLLLLSPHLSPQIHTGRNLSSSEEDVQLWLTQNHLGSIADFFLGMNGQRMLELRKEQVRAYVADAGLSGKLWSLIAEVQEKNGTQAQASKGGLSLLQQSTTVYPCFLIPVIICNYLLFCSLMDLVGAVYQSCSSSP